MNERMAELFGEAGISDSINEEFGIEYLAELIVRECASIVEGSPWNLPRGYKAVDQAELVKKHFGVEQ